MELTAAPLDLSLCHTFSTSRSSSDVAQNVLLKIRYKDLEGLGEAAPIRYYGQSQQTCIEALERMERYLQGRDPFELQSILTTLRSRFPKEPSAITAVDIALHDLMGKVLGIPLWKFWGLDATKTPQTSFTIGIAELNVIQKKVSEAARYPILKIKVGSKNDLEIMREVRRLAPKKTLRVDANCGWTVREAIEKIRALEKLGVEFVEQPIKPGDNAALKKIRQSVGIPLMTDESSLVPEDVPGLLGCVDGINIKLVKCGGLREAVKMIHIARACGLKIMLGCMIESSILISAAAHLSPLADYADLDGNVLIANDPYRGAILDKNARLVLPSGSGLGVQKTRPGVLVSRK